MARREITADDGNCAMARSAKGPPKAAQGCVRRIVSLRVTMSEAS